MFYVILTNLCFVSTTKLVILWHWLTSSFFSMLLRSCPSHTFFHMITSMCFPPTDTPFCTTTCTVMGTKGEKKKRKKRVFHSHQNIGIPSNSNHTSKNCHKKFLLLFSKVWHIILLYKFWVVLKGIKKQV